mgnify:FL=1
MSETMWCSPPPTLLIQAADAAEECHARLRAMAESEQPIRIRYGDTFTNMLLADPRTREKAHLW